jgi:hypothetical protein
MAYKSEAGSRDLASPRLEVRADNVLPDGKHGRSAEVSRGCKAPEDIRDRVRGSRHGPRWLRQWSGRSIASNTHAYTVRLRTGELVQIHQASAYAILEGTPVVIEYGAQARVIPQNASIGYL